jgi:hypothetical protein
MAERLLNLDDDAELERDPARKILRSIHEGARDIARDIATTDDYLVSRRERKKIEMLFAHLKRIADGGPRTARLDSERNRKISDDLTKPEAVRKVHLG